MSREQLPATILVIFGITGDLSHRYLLPALVQIGEAGQFPDSFQILGVSRSDIKKKDLFKKSEKPLDKYTSVFQMDPANPKDFESLKDKLNELGKDAKDEHQIIFYFAVPPAAVLPIVRNLGLSGLNGPNTKLLLEKPFGTDLSSARELIEEIGKHYPEKQVYRIDHYLAKGMAQNIAVFLGSNAIFRYVWSNQFIERVNIIAVEQIDIEGRVELWEETGILRDFVQSHLLQLAALTLMEPCSHMFDFSELPARRLAALQQLEIADASRAIRGQYKGYRQEVKNPKSTSDTFVALTLKSSDSRWQGVPVNIVNGKSLDQKLTQIEIHFKKTQSAEANLLTLRLHPKEGIELDLWVKEPGYEQKLQKQPLRFIYEQRFGRVPEAYEQVLVDAMHSKQSLFASSQEVLESWRILQPLIDYWKTKTDQLAIYEPGSTIRQVLSEAKS